MAIEKYSPNDIPDLNQDWGQDVNDPQLRPYSGRAVQKLIRDQLIELREAKFGHVAYEAGSLIFYDEDNGTVISTVVLSGIIYAINLESTTPSTFNVLTSDSIKTISITPSSKEGTIGTELVDFFEDYTWIMSVDSGSGFVNVANGDCLNGSAFSVDIRPYVKVGLNRIRFSVTGLLSNQTKSTVFTANLTSLTLNCVHPWQRAWIQGEPYYIQGIFFSGNMQKTLNIRLDDDNDKMYSQTFSASTSYVSSPFIFNMTDKFPGTTGIHKVDIWISGPGVESQHFIFDLMCVLAEEKLTAKLLCINEVKSPVYNYEDQELFKFAIYGTNDVTFNITANDADVAYDIVTDQLMTVVAEDKISYALRLEVPTEALNGVSLSISASVDEDTQTKILPIDNSNAFAPVADADFYMNASLRTNSSANREDILNDMPEPDVLEYPATWTGFSWEKDAWSIDDQGVKCLVVQAGSSVISETFKPLSVLNAGRSLTLEFKLKVDNTADYDTPIMSIMSTETYDVNTTNGVIIFPTNILVLSSANRNTVQQSVNFEEGHQLHFVIIFQREYGSTGRNLCRIYINGVQQCVFEYDGSANFGNGYLKLGQDSTDLYLYMLRYYNDRAFEADSVLKNWLNALTETIDYSRQGLRVDNDIIDGININYDLVKQRGFNTMVIEMQNDSAIPSLTNAISAQSTLTVEYNDHPEWNFKITNAPIDGQGTTSMRYYRWNLRWKLAKGANASIWTYADGSTSTTKGWFDGNGNHLKIGRITAKKNIASSSQGHKMGATAMYDDLYKQLDLADNLPVGARVAVFQYPVLGFQKFADGSYQFIGLYTIGPDKGDKDTFGYDTSAFPDLLSIEGPNHAPLGTRFLHPWIDVEYSTDDETLKFGGEEGWDLAAYNDSKYEDAAQVLSLYEAEWKPAYDLVYFCSTYLKSIAETGLTLEQINADTVAFRNATDLLTTRRNEVVTLYDENYNLVYYRNLTSQYEVLVGHDVRTYLDGYLANQVNPTTEELIAARKAKFLAEVENYFDIEALLYHECFLMLIGASDNHAKNFYPFKLKTLAAGGRWQFRQDDLDTILATDNNGNPTKKYHVEPGDLTPNGTDIYQGSSSVLWTLVRATMQTRLRAMMVDMVNGLASMASAKGLAKGTLYETIFAMFNYYFWQNAAKYFPVLAYAEDATYGYVHVWSLNPGATYNGVYPLTQALGTQLEAEQHWALRRIIYIFSKYSIGGFAGSSDDGLSSIEFTPGQAFTFNLVPAINMYPTGNLGGGNNIVGVRTPAGQTCQIIATSDGTTTYYLKGLDWLTSLGDLSGLVLTSRGGVSTINFSVKSKRIRAIKFGDANPANVAFNATALDVQGSGLEEIDVRNVTSIISPVDLSNCPRLKEARFEGSSVPTVILPTGSKITYLSLPSAAQNLYLNGLPLLSDANLIVPEAAYLTIRGLYLSNCPRISMADLLRTIMDTDGNMLRFLHLSIGVITGTASDLNMLAALTEPYDPDTDTGYGRVVYDSVNKLYSYNDQKPYLSGTINLDEPAYTRDVTALRSYFNLLTITAPAYYVWFEDPEVLRLLLTVYGDGVGLSDQLVSQNITLLGNLFQGNTVITEFNELKEFLAITSLLADSFNGCSALESIELPANLTNLGAAAFLDCINLSRVVLPATLTSLGSNSDANGVFENCASLTNINPTYLTTIGKKAFKNAITYNAGLPTNVEVIGEEAFYGCIGMTGILNIPNSCTTIGPSAFENCIDLSGDLILSNSITNLGSKAFKNVGCNGSLVIGNGLATIPTEAFSGAKFTGNLTIGEGVTGIEANAFASVAFSGNLHLPASLTNLAPGSILFNSFTSLSLGLGYDLDVYNDFTVANFSVDSINLAILNCASGTESSPKTVRISFAKYKELELYYPQAISDAAARYINVINEGFVSFISPEGFNDPAFFSAYGEDMNIYDAFNAYPDANKKLIWSVKNDRATTDLLAIDNVTYAYHQDDGIMTDYAILAGGTINWTPGSTKRHVILISTLATYVQTAMVCQYATWLYVGKDVDLRGVNLGPSAKPELAHLNYIHVYNLDTMTIINDRGYYGVGSGSLRLPKNLTALGMQAFTNSRVTEKLIIDSTSLTVTIYSSTYGPFENCLFTDIQINDKLEPTVESSVSFLFNKCTSVVSVEVKDPLCKFKYINGVLFYEGNSRYLLLATPGIYVANDFDITPGMVVSMPGIPLTVTDHLQLDAVSLLSGFNNWNFNTVSLSNMTYISSGLSNSTYNSLYVQINGNLPNYFASAQYQNPELRGTTIIGEGVTGIGERCWQFHRATAGSYIEFPSTLTSIGKECFQYRLGDRPEYVRIKAALPPAISANVLGITSLLCPLLVPAASIYSYYTATNLTNRVSYMHGYQEFLTNDVFPDYSEGVYNTCTWYSDKKCTIPAGVSASADGEYYCKLTTV